MVFVIGSVADELTAHIGFGVALPQFADVAVTSFFANFSAPYRKESAFLVLSCSLAVNGSHKKAAMY